MTTQATAGQPPQSIDDVLDEFEKGPVTAQPELPEVEVVTGDEPPSATEEKKEPAKEDPVAKLQREVAEVRAREAAERQKREQFARLAAQKAIEAQRALARAQTSDYDLISNALDSATDKMAALEQAYATAFAEGDGVKAAGIQKQMSILGARITQLEDGKARLEQQAQLQRQRAQMQARQQQMRPQPQPQQNVDPFEASIAHYSEPSKKWLREHREFVTQPGKFDDVLAAHYIVTKKQSLTPDTPEYFEAVEQELGLRRSAEPKEPPRRGPPGAPVSRGNGNGGGKPTQVRLTADEVRIAHDMGMTPEEYAIGKHRLEQQKAQMRVH